VARHSTCTLREESRTGEQVLELFEWRDADRVTWNDCTIVRPKQEPYGTRRRWLEVLTFRTIDTVRTGTG
jgi:hypothetical protein